MTQSRQPAITRKTSRWAVPALMLLCLALRLPGLMALPIFGDEAIYLRWAQLVRGDGALWGGSGHHWWVSLADPKPPLHFWLIALVFGWADDPLMAARLISVAAGVLCVPLAVWIADELGFFFEPREPGAGMTSRAVGLMAAILMCICPFLAFYQRLATQDALFTMESMAVVWLSLRWSRATLERRPCAKAPSTAPEAEVPQGESSAEVSYQAPDAAPVRSRAARSSWLWALALGAAIGAGLLTRQGVSYTIALFPAGAWIMHALAGGRRDGGIPWFKSLFQLLLAAILAAAMWMPYLTAELHNRALSTHTLTDAPDKPVTDAELMTEVKRRIFYQDSFMGGAGERLNIASRNMRLAFVPRYVGGDPREPSSGWLHVYMTPPLYGLGIAGLAYLAFRQGRVFLLVLLWFVLLMGPLIFLANTIYSRYVLAGVPPLLFAAAYLLADVTAMLIAGIPRKPVLGAGVALLLWGFVMAWPIREIGTQATDWSHQTMTARGEARSDRYQYITGWTAGYATRDAVAYLRDAAKTDPIVVITTSGWGTPGDAMWVYLSGIPNVQIFFTDDNRVLRPGLENGTFRLKDDKWIFPPERQVHLVPNARIFFVTNDPVHAATDVPATTFFNKANPNFGPPKTFYGVEGRGGEGVSLFPVSTSGPWPGTRGRGG